MPKIEIKIYSLKRSDFLEVQLPEIKRKKETITIFWPQVY
jgi:hypothetical protein